MALSEAARTPVVDRDVPTAGRGSAPSPGRLMEPVLGEEERGPASSCTHLALYQQGGKRTSVGVLRCPHPGGSLVHLKPALPHPPAGRRPASPSMVYPVLCTPRRHGARLGTRPGRPTWTPPAPGVSSHLWWDPHGLQWVGRERTSPPHKDAGLLPTSPPTRSPERPWPEAGPSTAAFPGL